MTDTPARPKGVSRRGFLQGVSTAALTPSLLKAGRTEGGTAQEGAAKLGPGPVAIELTVNGAKQRVRVEPRTTLLELLRDALTLTGAKEVCALGACGACSVEVDGRLVNACLVLAIDCDGKEVTTVEGLAAGDELHPVQQAFVEHDALQCGYCTPGMVMAVRHCLTEHPDADRETIRRALAGNLCRCGTYPRIFDAAEDARERLKRGEGKR